MDYFTQIPVEQKIVLLAILIIVVAMVFKTPVLVSIPHLTIIFLTSWVGLNVFLKNPINQHTCKQMTIVDKHKVDKEKVNKEEMKEGFDLTNGDNLELRHSKQHEDDLPDYKNIKIHNELHQSKSYPTTKLDKNPEKKSRSITNYPFQMLEDKDSNVRAEYTQDYDVGQFIKGDIDKEIYDMFYEKKCSGDTRIARRMSHMATMPKRAIEARSRLDKYALAPFLEEELEQHANSIWWENEELEHMF